MNDELKEKIGRFKLDYYEVPRSIALLGSNSNYDNASKSSCLRNSLGT